MKVLAINGSYRKGRTIDNLISKAINGACGKQKDLIVNEINLIDKQIEYCRNCMVCRNNNEQTDYVDCVISDDLNDLFPLIQESDYLIFGTPINCGTVTSVMKTFLERTCWTLARKGNEPIQGCPVPRSPKQKRAIIIVSTGIVPLELQDTCDDATPLIRSNCESCFNAKVVGTLYAGAVEKNGVKSYFDDAFKLGGKLIN